MENRVLKKKMPDEMVAVLQRHSLLATRLFKRIIQVALMFTDLSAPKSTHTRTNTLAFFFPF